MSLNYYKVNSKYFSDNDWEYIYKLKICLKNNPKKNNVSEIIEYYSKIPINSILRSIEMDLEGLFEIKNTEYKIYTLKDKVKNISKEEIILHIIKQLENINRNEFEISETLYKPETIKIIYEGNEISVKEILEDAFWYKLYQNKYDNNNYYLEIIKDGLFIDIRIYKVKNEDIKIVKSLNSEKISRLCRKYLYG